MSESREAMVRKARGFESPPGLFRRPQAASLWGRVHTIEVIIRILYVVMIVLWIGWLFE